MCTTIVIFIPVYTLIFIITSHYITYIDMWLLVQYYLLKHCYRSRFFDIESLLIWAETTKIPSRDKNMCQKVVLSWTPWSHITLRNGAAAGSMALKQTMANLRTSATANVTATLGSIYIFLFSFFFLPTFVSFSRSPNPRERERERETRFLDTNAI